jgi:hypothetical protein
MEAIIKWFCNTTAEPDFKQIVEKSLMLFGVFTGATLSFYIKDFLFAAEKDLPPGFMNFPMWSKACVAAAAIALLLRYIVGSAAHLNARYVPKVRSALQENIVADALGNTRIQLALTENKEIVSRSLWCLFFDIVVLVAFGILAVAIIHAPDLQQFMLLALCFLLAGFVWGLVAYASRREDAEIAKRWMVIDIIQAAITGVLLCGLRGDWIGSLKTTAILAAIYVFCLLLDLAVISRPPAVPQA